MKTILYVGNKLSAHGYSPTSIETLGPLLAQKYHLIYTSDRRNLFFRLLDMIYTLLKHRRDISFIIVDTYSTLSFYYAWMIARMAKSFNVPFIPVLRGGNLPNRLKDTPRLCRQVFQSAYRNVAPSGYMQAAFAQHGYKSVVIPNFISIKNYCFKLRSQVRPRLLWVRSFEVTYHPALAIHVLAKLKKQYPEVMLCMVGPDKDGSLEQCRQLAKDLEVLEQVTFTGRLSKTDWHQLAQEYDIFINTTNADNTPVSVIEAMALGLPVVSTNVGGIPYLLEQEKTGLLVTPGDTGAMCEAIVSLIESPELCAMLSQNGRQQVEGYDEAIVLAKWQEILN